MSGNIGVHEGVSMHKHTQTQTQTQTHIHPHVPKERSHVKTHLWIYTDTMNVHTCVKKKNTTYAHTCIHTHLRLWQISLRARTRNTCIHAYMHTCIHAYMHTHTPASLANQSARTQAQYMHTCINTYTHTCVSGKSVCAHASACLNSNGDTFPSPSRSNISNVCLSVRSERRSCS